MELGLSGVGRLTLVNRNPDRAQPLVALLNDRVKVATKFVKLSGDYAIDADTQIFINATSIGLGDVNARVPIDLHSLRAGLIVSDVIFNPAVTRLLRDARDRGCQTLDGLGMLVNQGAIAFKIWTGRDPDATVMREALEEFLAV